MKLRTLKIAILAMLVGGTGVAVQAALQIGTGLDALGNPLSAYSTDPNWIVSTTGSDPVSSAPLVYPNSSWPLGSGTWVANQPHGQWISPVGTGTQYQQPAGVTVNFSQAQNQMFYYTQTIPAGYTSISGMFSSDNPGALFINGSSTPVVQSPGWGQIPTDTYDWNVWTKFFDVSLKPGQANTITFEVYNLAGSPPGNPTGLIVQGTAVVPEPTTMIAGALLLLPFGASTLRMLRKKTQTA